MRMPRPSRICSPIPGPRCATCSKPPDAPGMMWAYRGRPTNGRPRCANLSLSPFGDNRSAERARCLQPRDDQRIETEATAIVVNGKDQLNHQEEEIGPRPLAVGIVEPKPQIEDLQRADKAPEAHEQPED